MLHSTIQTFSSFMVNQKVSFISVEPNILIGNNLNISNSTKSGNASVVHLALRMSMGVVDHLGVPAARLPPSLTKKYCMNNNKMQQEFRLHIYMQYLLYFRTNCRPHFHMSLKKSQRRKIGQKKMRKMLNSS